MDYKKLLQCILDIGEEMLVCGAEVGRVEDSIERMCTAYGYDIDRINVFIITSNMQITCEAPDGEIITQIRRVIRNNSNFDKLDYLNDLSRYVCANKPDLDQLRKRYEEVMSRKEPSLIVNLFGAVLIAGSFAIFFGGNLLDGFSSAIVGVIICLLTRFFQKFEKNQLAMTFIISFVSGILSILLVMFNIGTNADKIMIGAIMLLIPGIAMTNSLRDMLTGDIVAGLLRLINSLLLAISIACGFGLAIFLLGGVI